MLFPRLDDDEKINQACQCKVNPNYSWAVHAVRTALHVTRLAIAYALMLVVMTFNAGFILSILAGATLGFLITAKNRFTSSEQYCH